jgi:predicted Zn-dependent protease
MTIGKRLLGGVMDVTNVAGLEPKFDAELLNQAESLDAILAHYTDRNDQVDADRLYAEVGSSGIARPDAPLIVFTTKDLTTHSTSFIFGFGDPDVGLSVQSVKRYMDGIRGSAAEEVRLRVVRHIARHEYGHMLGLTEKSIVNQDLRGGVYSGHCVNECTMRQVPSVQEVVDLSARVINRPQAGFCSDCVGVLQHMHQ